MFCRTLLGRFILKVMVCLAAGYCLSPSPLRAQDFTVNSTGDAIDRNPGDGVCSTGNTLPNTAGTLECTLRAAIDEANALAGSHTITLPAGTYNLTTAEHCSAGDNGTFDQYCVLGKMSIVGAGANATILDAGGQSRVMLVGPAGQLQLSGVTIQNGRQTGGNYGSGGGGGISNLGVLSVSNSAFLQDRADANGGGIYSTGTLSVIATTFQANNGGGYGGGIFQSYGGTLSIENCLFSHNSAGQGGGLYIFGTQTQVTGSTFTQNFATTFGGGLTADESNDGLFRTVHITNSTIAGNQAGWGGGGATFFSFITGQLNNVTITGNSPSGISDHSAKVVLQNTILAVNPTLSSIDCDTNLNISNMVSNGHNLIGNPANCNFAGDNSTNIVGKDPLLGILADNGGFTQTIALGASSPAIDAGSPLSPGSGGVACAAVDQRGVNRPQGTACDIGAFESQGGFAVTKASPARAGNGGAKLLLIDGNGFSLHSAPTLSCAGKTIAGSGVGVDVSGTVLMASFDLTGVAPTTCDVTVANPSGQSATLVSALTVENPSAPNLWSSVGTRRAVRVGLPNIFRFYYGNLGNTDARGVAFGLYLTTNIASQLQIKVTPPIAQTGDVTADWTYVPIKELATTPGFNFVPLFLPVVPAGFTGEVDISVNAPLSLHGQSFTIATSIGPAAESTAQVVDPALLADLVGGANQYAAKYLNASIASASDGALNSYYTKEIQQIVAASTNAILKNLLQQPPIYSLAQIQDAGASNILQLPPHYVGGPGGGGSGGSGGSGGAPGDGAGGAGSGSGDDSGDDDCGWIGWCDDPPPPPPPCDKWPPTACGGGGPNSGPLVSSLDPNDKTGPSGAGAPQFIAGAAPLNYTIQFTNLATAGAAAQTVVVTDQLDRTKVNLASVALGAVTFGGTTVVPPPGVQQYTKDVDLRPARNLLARVAGKLDASTGILTWTFSSIDPLTLEATQDPLVGFLPPDTAPPNGEGSVSFTVSAVPNLATGTTICNQGVVVFDNNAAIDTAAWCNSIDLTPPVSSVAALPVQETTATFPVAWSGADAGSGVAGFNIYSSDNGGPFVLWRQFTTAASAAFAGQVGHSYQFFSQAVDNVGNVEALKSNPDARTIVGAAPAPPVLALQPSSQTITAGNAVTFAAGATGNPVPTVQWQQSAEGGATFTNISGATATSLTFVGLVAQNGYLYRAVFTNASGTAASNAAKLTVNPRLGDVNGDGVVNCADIAIVKASFGLKKGQTGFDPRADVNNDGIVNIIDLAIVSKQLPAGTTCN